jgi:hypothetical protein
MPEGRNEPFHSQNFILFYLTVYVMPHYLKFLNDMIKYIPLDETQLLAVKWLISISRKMETILMPKEDH